MSLPAGPTEDGRHDVDLSDEVVNTGQVVLLNLQDVILDSGKSFIEALPEYSLLYRPEAALPRMGFYGRTTLVCRNL